MLRGVACAIRVLGEFPGPGRRACRKGWEGGKETRSWSACSRCLSDGSRGEFHRFSNCVVAGLVLLVTVIAAVVSVLTVQLFLHVIPRFSSQRQRLGRTAMSGPRPFQNLGWKLQCDSGHYAESQRLTVVAFASGQGDPRISIRIRPTFQQSCHVCRAAAGTAELVLAGCQVQFHRRLPDTWLAARPVLHLGSV